MKKVAHPNCVILHEVYDEANKTYLVLDLITGGTVMLNQKQAPPRSQTLMENTSIPKLLSFILTPDSTP